MEDINLSDILHHAAKIIRVVNVVGETVKELNEQQPNSSKIVRSVSSVINEFDIDDILPIHTSTKRKRQVRESEIKVTHYQIAGREIKGIPAIHHTGIRLYFSNGTQCFYEYEKIDGEEHDPTGLISCPGEITRTTTEEDGRQFGTGDNTKWSNWGEKSACGENISKGEIEDWMDDEESMRKYQLTSSSKNSLFWNCRTFVELVLKKIGGSHHDMKQIQVFH